MLAQRLRALQQDPAPLQPDEHKASLEDDDDEEVEEYNDDEHKRLQRELARVFDFPDQPMQPARASRVRAPLDEGQPSSKRQKRGHPIEEARKGEKRRASVKPIKPSQTKRQKLDTTPPAEPFDSGFEDSPPSSSSPLERKEESEAELKIRSFHYDDDTDIADPEFGARAETLLLPTIDDGKMRYEKTTVLEYMRQFDLANVAKAEKEQKMGRFERLMRRCAKITDIQIERHKFELSKYELVTRDSAVKNIGRVSTAIEKEKQEAMQRYSGLVSRIKSLAHDYLQSRVQWGEQASLDPAQEEIVNDACLSCAPFIFGKVWDQCKQDLFKRLNIRGIRRWTVVMLPRQFGKTLLVSLMCAQLLMDCPQINIIVFSVNQNSANRLLGAVKECLRLLVGNNTHWIQSNSQKVLSILRPGVRHKYGAGKSAKGETKVNTIKAVPGKVDSSYLFFSPLHTQHT